MDQNRISLSAEAVYNKDFKVDTKGYRIKEVDAFLDEIIKDYEKFSKILEEKDKERNALLDEIMTLKSDNRDLKMKLEIANDENIKPQEMGNLDIMRRLAKLEKVIYGKDRDI